MCFSGSYNQMSESDEEYYLYDKGHPLSLLNVDWKDMYQYHYYCHRYWSPIQLSNFDQSFQYNNNHLFVSVILESHFVNDCTLRTHQISLFKYCKTPADIGLSIQSNTSPTFSIPEYLVDDRLRLVHWLLDADALSLWFILSSDMIRSEENDGIVNEWYYCIYPPWWHC